MVDLLKRLTVRSVVVILLVSGALILAILDSQYRPHFVDLAKMGLVGYFGQLLPRRNS